MSEQDKLQVDSSELDASSQTSGRADSETRVPDWLQDFTLEDEAVAAIDIVPVTVEEVEAPVAPEPAPEAEASWEKRWKDFSRQSVVSEVVTDAGKAAAAPPEAPAPVEASGKTGTVAGDVRKGMGQLVEGLDASFEDKAREYADRITAGDDPKTMGVPEPLRARVSELVAQNRVAVPELKVPVAPGGDERVGEELPEAAAGSAEEAMEFPAMSFAARVKAAGGLVARAVKEVGGLGGLLEKVAEEQRIAAEMRQGLSGETGMETPELSGEELEILRKAHEVLVSHKSDSGMSRAEETLRANVLELQEQYKLGRKLAEEANEKYGAELKRAADELKPGWFEAEPAVVREMAELQVFFDQSGNEAELRRKIAEIEASQGNYMWTILTNKQKRQVEARLLEANTGLAALTLAERFMARTDMPKTLKAVIEVARAGRKFEFGTGPVAEFRREVYESIMGTLGVEAAPAPTPEPEPAPAAADEVETPMTEVPVETEVAAETPEQRFEIRKQEFAGALAELNKAKGDTNGTEDEQKVRLAEAFNQVIGAAMEFMEEGDNAKEVVREFLSGALGTNGGKKLTEVAVRSRMDEAGVFQASTPEEKKKKLKEAGLWGLLTLLLELGMNFTDKAVGGVVNEVKSATGGGR